MNSTMQRLAPPLKKKLNAELKAGEAIVWLGQPNPRRLMMKGFMLWFFFIPWTAFALFWMAGAAQFKLPDLDDPGTWFALFGVPFVLIGGAGLSAPVWMYYGARHTVHAITNRRALTISGVRAFNIKGFTREQITHIERVERADGSGDLILAETPTRNGRGIRREGFFAIADLSAAAAALDRLIAE